APIAANLGADIVAFPGSMRSLAVRREQPADAECYCLQLRVNVAGGDLGTETVVRREIDVAEIDIQIVQAEDHIRRILVFNTSATGPADAQIIRRRTECDTGRC